MKKGIRNLCNDNSSTSILNQQNKNNDHPPAAAESNPTLEEMILHLELEEEIARKEKLNQNNLASLRGGGRMSCVNSSDILRSARNALNQYPRFSLDGKDAMYRSSFTVEKPGRKSVCCDYGIRERLDGFDFKSGRKSCGLGGERSVMWCKPGVIARLMGLEAMPVPISSRRGRETLSCVVKKRQNLRRRVERHEMERRLVMDGGGERTTRGGKGGYRAMKPVAAELEAVSGGGVWPTRSFI